MIERLPYLSATQFHAAYLDVKPVVLTAMTAKWPARESFNVQRFAGELGDTEVTIARYAGARDESFLAETSRYRERITLRQWLTAAADPAWSIREGVELFAEHPELIDELGFASLFPRGHKRFEHLLWLGPAGYTTGLHTDEIAVNLLAHFAGRKTVTLYPPSQTPLLYPQTERPVEDGMYSAVNVIAPDLERHPRFAEATPLVCELAPGDLLYIPRGWWHWVRGNDLCISVSGMSHTVYAQRLVDRCASCTSSWTSSRSQTRPLPMPAQDLEMSSFQVLAFMFSGQNGHVRHWVGRASYTPQRLSSRNAQFRCGSFRCRCPFVTSQCSAMKS